MRRVGRGLLFELLDRILRQYDGRGVQSGVGIDQAVQGVVEGCGPLAVDADGISLAHAHIGLLSVGLDRTRAEQQELHEVPPVKRQFVHLTLAYELRYGC